MLQAPLPLPVPSLAVRGQDSGFNLGPIVTASAVAKQAAAVGVGKYDDTHAGWTYAGSWQTYAGSGPYNSTNHYTTTAGDSATFTFSGGQFVLSYIAYTNRGSFEVWVDGGLVTTVNAYSATLIWQKTYTSPVYSSGTHTVMIKKAGTSGTFIDVDAIQIINPDLVAPDGVGSLSAVTGSAAGSINLGWTAPAKDAGNPASGAVASYLVRYSLANMDYVYGDYELEIQVNGKSIGVVACSGTDRVHRWRDWPAMIPAEQVTDSTLNIKQMALTAGRDVNMFHIWVYQPK